MAAEITPYGSWRSPISAAAVAAGTLRLGQLVLDGEAVYWVEGRPEEQGRNAVMRSVGGAPPEECGPPDVNVRSQVHEYGGGAFTVAGGVLFYVDWAEQRLWSQAPGGKPRPLVPAGTGWRFADLEVDHLRERVICVGEHHGGGEASNCLVTAPTEGSHPPSVLVSGDDFYAAPRLSPDGRTLAWLSWRHPHMPWDSTRLWTAAVLEDGSLGDADEVAGGEAESVLQPVWSPGGVLHFLSDRSGAWNLYCATAGGVAPVIQIDAELGAPPWQFANASYAFADLDTLVVGVCERGRWRLAVRRQAGRLQFLELGISTLEPHLVAGAGVAHVLAGSPLRSTALLRVPLDGNQRPQAVRRSSSLDLNPELVSEAEAIEFATSDNAVAHAWYYPPRNPAHRAPSGERPPLLVHSHGGPTSAAGSALSAEVQFWTSRGFAVVDVNYRGSSGFGREYRRALHGRWGIRDVDDCCAAAEYLVARGDADRARLAIAGGSAGGYTTLCALTFRDLFAAGTSRYGIGDLELIAASSHKFESRYDDALVGRDDPDAMRARSPIHRVDQLSCPLLLLQGLDDEVVPPEQSVMMFEAVRSRGIPCAYIAFAGEQHGFRRADTIIRALEAELAFYASVFGFQPADPLPPIPLENAPGQPPAAWAAAPGRGAI